MRLVLVLCILLCSSTTHAIEVSFFDNKPLYQIELADPRAIDTGISFNTSKYKKERIVYIEASLGHTIPVMTVDIGPLSLQTGLEVGFWASLGRDGDSFPLLTQDFIISVPLYLKLKKLTAAIKFNHISAHLGDGFDDLLQEKLSAREQRDLEFAEDILETFADDEDIGIILIEPFSYSRDFMSIHLAYEDRFGAIDLRLYSHGGYVHKMIPDHLSKYFFGNGMEAVWKLGTISPYYALDYTHHQDTDSTDFSGELGIMVLPNKGKYLSLRVALTAFVGKDRRGQLVGNKLKQLGIGLFIH